MGVALPLDSVAADTEIGKEHLAFGHIPRSRIRTAAHRRNEEHRQENRTGDSGVHHLLLYKELPHTRGTPAYDDENAILVPIGQEGTTKGN